MGQHERLANIEVQFYGLLLDASRGGEGEIVALSARGCTVRTLEPLQEHAYLQLRLIPADMELVVFIELAAVREVHGPESILEFLTIREDQNVLLQQLLECRDQRG